MHDGYPIGIHPDETYVVANSQLLTLPAVINGGGQWKGAIQWDNVVVRAEKGGFLYAQIEHSMSDRPIFSKVEF